MSKELRVILCDALMERFSFFRPEHFELTKNDLKVGKSLICPAALTNQSGIAL